MPKDALISQKREIRASFFISHQVKALKFITVITTIIFPDNCSNYSYYVSLRLYHQNIHC